MIIQFTKMQGLGNDFMVVDATKKSLQLTAHEVEALADRHRGVGFDQLLILAAPLSEQADFTYIIFNCDGSTAEQCGNGARCVARFIQRQKLSRKHEFRLITAGKITRTILESDNSVTVEMDEPYFEPARIPFETSETSGPYSLKIAGQWVTFYVVGVGNPHVVIRVDDTAMAQVDEIGKELSVHPSFPQGVNVGFMQVLSPDHIALRVFERGVGQTLACGSGACAAMAVGRSQALLQERVQVTQPGGELWVSWSGAGSVLRMRGPAHFVYDGEVNTDSLLNLVL